MKDRRLVSFFLFILQISVIGQAVAVASSSNQLASSLTEWVITSSIGWYYITGSGTAGLFILLDYGHGRYQHRKNGNSLLLYSVKEGPSIDAKKKVFIFMAAIIFGALLVFLIVTLYIPSIILPAVVLASVWWVNAPRIYPSKRQVLGSRLL
jgi:hypothetical protein